MLVERARAAAIHPVGPGAAFDDVGAAAAVERLSSPFPPWSWSRPFEATISSVPLAAVADAVGADEPDGVVAGHAPSAWPVTIVKLSAALPIVVTAKFSVPWSQVCTFSMLSGSVKSADM